jgi:hypothetical protein
VKNIYENKEGEQVASMVDSIILCKMHRHFSFFNFLEKNNPIKKRNILSVSREFDFRIKLSVYIKILS